MSFSLLFKDEKKVVSTLDEVLFGDLKIKKILEYLFDDYKDVEEMIEIIKNIPTEDDLIFRQEILNDFLNDKNNKLDNLYYKLIDLVSRYKSCKEANEAIKRKVFLIFYVYNYYLFLEEVLHILGSIKIESKCLLSLIDQIKKILSSSEVIEKREEVKQLYNGIINQMSFNIEYKSGAPYYKMDFKKISSLEDDLISIADSLGIALIKTPRQAAKKEVNHFFLSEALKGNTKLSDAINTFCEASHDIFDVSYLVAEVKFFISLKHVFYSLEKEGIAYCKASISPDNLEWFKEAYDITLTTSKIKVVPNDYKMSDDEHMQFVLGVNSGGKTCYLRSIAVNYVFFMVCGFCFAKEARLKIVTHIYTHFPNEENYSVGDGRLRDEIKRIEAIKSTFSSNVIIFLNETFSSTNEERACELTKQLINDFSLTKTRVIYVTHQYKVFEEVVNHKMGFYTPVVNEDNNNQRTYKIKRVDKKLLSYVDDILKKYGLTKAQLQKNFQKKREQ